jgi:hypothetical protein
MGSSRLLKNSLPGDPGMDRRFRAVSNRSETRGNRKPRFSISELKKARTAFFNNLLG